jgi:hypothetical protein
MASPRELVKQRRDAIPRRARVVACVLRRQDIRMPVRGQEHGRRACRCLRARRTPPEEAFSPRARRIPPEGALRPRARWTPPEGVFSPRARRTPPEGVFSPRARRTPPEGLRCLRARRTLLEGHSAVPPWWAAGATRVVVVSRMCFRCVS